MFGGGESNPDVLLERRDDSFKVVSDKVVRAEINPYLVGTNGPFESSPLAVTGVAVVLLNAGSIVQTGIRLALSHTALANSVQACQISPYKQTFYHRKQLP